MHVLRGLFFYFAKTSILHVLIDLDLLIIQYSTWGSSCLQAFLLLFWGRPVKEVYRKYFWGWPSCHPTNITKA